MFSLSKKVGIDLGTANSLVYVAGVGIILNEPTVVAVSLDDERVLAVGNEAKEMLGRTPGNIKASRPMRDGVIADYRVTEAMLRYFLSKVVGKGAWFKPDVVISVPVGVTQVERRAVLEATLSAGARNAYLIDEPLAAAVGAGVPIGDASGNMILNMGGGASEAVVVSLGGVVVSKSVRVAGNKLDEAIASYVRRKENLIIGEQTAEKVKLRVGNALQQAIGLTQAKVQDSTLKRIDMKGLDRREEMEVKGRDSISGLPRTIKLTSQEVNEAIQMPLEKIVEMVKRVLEEVPPELSSDIIDKGIVMTGGTALLDNFDKLLTQKTNVPAFVAEESILCVAKGTGIVVENLEAYKRSVSGK